MGITLKGKHVLVTGGTGFVGSHLVSQLASQGNLVVTTRYVNDPRSFFESNRLGAKVIIKDCDVRNFRHIFNVITAHEIDTIFHLAAQPLVDVAFSNPMETIETNILGTLNILESARLYPNIKAVVVASSDKAYGKGANKKYTESDPLTGDHPYEVSKSAADLLCTTYARTYHVPVTISRCGNIYGEGDLNFSRIIPGIIKALITGQKLTVRSNGKLVRDYVYVGDVVRGYFLLAQHIQKTVGEAYNFGSQETHSVLGLIKHIEKQVKIKIPYAIRNQARNEIPFQSLDFSKAKTTFGWEPQATIADTITPMLQWYRTTLLSSC